MKRKTKNQVNGFVGWLVYLTAILVGLGIGGLFINGTFLNGIILNWLPEIVHTVAGWIIIGSTIIGALVKFMK